MVKHILCDCKCKYGSTTCISNQKRNNDKCQRVCKKYNTCNSCNRSKCICENSRYLKSIVDDYVIACDEIINVINSISINLTSTVPTNTI